MRKLIFLFLTTTAFAALPPLAQSTREFQALLSDQRFYDSLGSAEQIKEIIRIKNGFLVLTKNYMMQVGVKYTGADQRIMGPIRFELDFQKPINLQFFLGEEQLN